MLEMYDPQELERQALEAIEALDLVFIDEIAAHLPCSRATFYNLKLDKLDSIKEALYKKKVSLKSQIRNNLFKDKTAQGQIALYKLVASKKELERLSNAPRINNTQITNNTRTFEGLMKRVAEDAEYDEDDEQKLID